MPCSDNNRILIVANDFTTIYNFRLELVQRLLKDGYAVTLVLPSDKRNKAFEQLGCTVRTIPLSRFGTNPITDLQTLFKLIGIIRDIRPKAVLTYTAKPNIYGGLAARFTNTPVICNVTGLGSNLQHKSLVGSIMLWLQRHAYKKAKHIFFQNQSNLDFFKAHGVVNDKSPVSVLPGSGVNLEQNPFEPYPPEKNPDGSKRKLKFITIARIRQDKGYDELFDAIRKLNGVAEFHIVGWYEEEQYKPIVEEMMAKYGVKFYENMPHEKIHGLIKECDCLIHPSHHEGMSNVILEAAAAGRPCIVSDIPGCREGVDDCLSGLTFMVKNTESLYEKIIQFKEFLYQERRMMAMAARRKMEQQFDRQLVIQQYLKLLEMI